ncbi:MAG: hypothetical protein COT17_01995 [Elusimicrobia bacterium CG08_land_8_20_14_0_20_51_18]|nr:MAG: hypothetical protein COT17_01995 [Elusimicrobia bacterium CG08_land_8_20_14_0_20_51_18]
MFFILLKRKLLGVKNVLSGITFWKAAKNSIFLFAGLLLLLSLYFTFYKLLKYLDGVELIGTMLIWKLTSIVFLMSFSMIVISSIIISMTTLYYSFDLKFLFSTPLNSRTLFMDKAADTVLYSSWTLVLALMPYIAALIYVKKLGPAFFFSYLLLLAPFIMMAAAFGLIFSLLVMYLFPSSRTRDITWLMGSLSIALVYVAFRFSKPEKLIRPDTLEIVAQYINYLQSPTVEYLPSWWLTKAMMAFSGGHYVVFLQYAGWLFLACLALYSFLYFLSGRLYPAGFSGAQNTPKFSGGRTQSFENRLLPAYPGLRGFLLVFLKERRNFSRDVRYWSQIILIIALIFVYLFSIKNLPLDTAEMKSFVSFLNIGIVGFVLSAICLRFIFPSLSLEGNTFWLLKSSPLSMESVFNSKLVFYSAPLTAMGFLLISFSNYLLSADLFISSVSIFTIIVMSFVMSAMGMGFGGAFPDFKVENIHQIESSYGGFVFMASAMGYVALTIGIFAWPVQMHFMSRFNSAYPFEWRWFYFCVAVFLALSFFAALVPWKIGLKNMEKYEI